MPELKLKREVLGWLIDAKSGHGLFSDDHERFGHEEAGLTVQMRKKTVAAPPILLLYLKAI